MASTANGVPTPAVVAQEPAADPAANKRKREPSEPSTDHAVRLSQTQSDILAIVKRYAQSRDTLRLHMLTFPQARHRAIIPPALI